MAVSPPLAAARGGRIFTVIFIACLAVLGLAVYVQETERIFPCPWCVLQRLGYLLIGLMALIAALHRPAPRGARIYSGIGVLASIAGASAAIYQILLEHDPVRAQACVGGVAEQVLDALNVGRLMPFLLQYDGPCTATPWQFLWLSIPQLSLVGFLLLGITFFFTPYLIERDSESGAQ